MNRSCRFIAVSLFFMLTAPAFAAVSQEGKAIIQLSRTLKRGSSGNDVVKLQEFLKTMPDVYPPGSTTGYFGPATERALKKFQARYGIEPTGSAGPKTRAKLNELLRATSL